MIAMNISQSDIAAVVKEWAPRLDMQHWKIVIDASLEAHLATCEAEPQYMEATLSFNPQRLTTDIQTERELEELVLHELVHARLWALANLLHGHDENERRMLEFLEEEAVTQVTGALLRAKYNGW